MVTDAEKPDISREIHRASERRRTLNIKRPEGAENSQWALCLSGGGIRSATFCLGVLQGLARTAENTNVQTAADARPASTAPATSPSLLSQFDYLSTVSGGGYIGAFFSALFVKGRLQGTDSETDDDRNAAHRAYRAMLDEPPGRMHIDTVYDSGHPGKAAIAWLRDNGRYLAPTGAGDMVYVAATSIRNWLAAHYVFATIALLILSLSLLVRIALFSVLQDYLSPLELSFQLGEDLVRWSSTWYGAGAVLLFVSIPLGIGFWFTHPSAGQTVGSSPRIITLASSTAAALGAASLAAGILGCLAFGRPPWSEVLSLVGSLTIGGLVYFSITGTLLHPPTITAHRALMTQWLSLSMMASLAVAGLAVAETLALTLAAHIGEKQILSAGSIIAALVWLTRFIAQRVEATSGSSQGNKKVLPSSLAGVLAGTLAVLLWLVVVTLQGLLVLWIASDGQPKFNTIFYAQSLDATLIRVASMTGALIVVALASGQFAGFLNLSTLQSVYSARLTRAYLGASNYKRFEQASSTSHSVAEPIKGDNLSVDALYSNKLAPIHYINVCVNQTVGPDAQLVQRDRKGKSLTIAPDGFYLDGEPYAFPYSSKRKSSELHAELTVGEWIGVSGAAVSTGLGRSTSLGTSLLLGFANVRLGRWWASGAVNASPSNVGLIRKLFRTQTYLIDEIRAFFQGTRLPYQYLSDGGHFENTGAYEMLRPERKISLLVVCDCGADPDYKFDNLANLVRLARIDHGLEICVNDRVTREGNPLSRYFSTPESIQSSLSDDLSKRSEKCAVLFDVFPENEIKTSDKQRLPSARIVLIKPTLVFGVPADVVNYKVQHSRFPQESTGDQFFDEAQWESYRKLGLEISRRVFPQGDDPSYSAAFRRDVFGIP